MQDQFSEYLIDESQPTRERALTSSSYKKVYQNETGKELPDKETNTELGTYGDALLKHAFCKILFDDKSVENITEKKRITNRIKSWLKVSLGIINC